MAQVIGNNQLKLNDGSVVAAQRGGWYDGRQFVDGSLSSPGQIHPSFGGVGAGDLVSKEVNLQSDTAQGNQPGDIERFLETQRQQVKQQGLVSPRAGASAGTPQPAQAGASGAGTAGATGAPIAPQPTIDLAGQFKSLLESSGISEKEADLSQKEREFIEAKGSINDNPFLSEATRVGRVAKIDKLFQERTANLRGEIATARADAETQLNLQLKQFDINSQQAKDAMDQFNALLNMGALANASGEDIANITRSTGLSSNIIQNAIKASQKTKANTQVIQSTDASGRVTVSVIDKDTGQVVNQQDLGKIGTSRAPKEPKPEKFDEQEAVGILINDIRSGQGVRDVFATFSGLLDPDQIIRVYNANSPHGTAKESAEELNKLGVNTEKLGIF